VKIPADIEDARTKLAQLDDISTKTGWHRAAIVYAFVKPAQGQRATLRETPRSFTLTEFAKLRIVGLADRDTVAHYYDAWQSAVDAGMAVPTTPGGDVALPAMAWPPNPTVAQTISDTDRRERIIDAAKDAGMKAGSKALDIAANPKSLAVAIQADEETARVAAEALAKTPKGRVTAYQAIYSARLEAIRPDRREVRYEPTTDRVDLVADIRKAERAFLDVAETAAALGGRAEPADVDVVTRFTAWVRNTADGIDSAIAGGSLEAQFAEFTEGTE
jgi:hypothetical protein